MTLTDFIDDYLVPLTIIVIMFTALVSMFLGLKKELYMLRDNEIESKLEERIDQLKWELDNNTTIRFTPESSDKFLITPEKYDDAYRRGYNDGYNKAVENMENLLSNEK